MIEKNIPIPPKPSGAWKELASRMEIGDSYFAETESADKCLRAAMRTLGMRGTRRYIADLRGYRIWRIE